MAANWAAADQPHHLRLDVLLLEEAALSATK
jgi:hypothetical protein